LVHGLSSNARTWDQVASRLAKAGHQVAAIDQRGHGLSEKPDNGYDFPSISKDLQNIIQQLDWHQPILVGQSWGGEMSYSNLQPSSLESVKDTFLSMEGF